MICALCKDREADKTNTHYLSDSVIRSALNRDGVNKRERGFYFSLETGMKYVDFNFQRATPVSALEKVFQRLPSEEEIEKAKEVPFSVNYVFCSVCEGRFTEIENRFVPRLLNYFRDTDFDGQDSISITGDDIVDTRLFFLLQVWRTSICETDYSITKDNAERLREIILNLQHQDIKEFPLAITYLNTLGDQKEYTRNYVGTTDDTNPSIIFMNDFIIQFYEDLDTVHFDSLSGFNSEENYFEFINFRENQFNFKVVSNNLRKKLLNRIIKESGVLPDITELVNDFIDKYYASYKVTPSLNNLLKFMEGLKVKNDEDLLQLSEKRIKDYIVQFVHSHKPQK